LTNERTAINALIAIAAVLLFGFAGETAASWNGWIAGALLLALSVAAMRMEQTWHEWVSLAVALWVILSPWLLGFTETASALWLHVVAGSAVAILAAIGAWQMHAVPRKV
jgi:hypothetical protein